MVIMIEVAIEEMVGSDSVTDPLTIRSEPKVGLANSTRAKWRSTRSRCRSVLKNVLTPPTLLEMAI